MNITLKIKNGVNYGSCLFKQTRKSEEKQKKHQRKQILMPTIKPYIKQAHKTKCKEKEQNQIENLRSTFEDSMIRSEDGELFELDNQLRKMKSCDFKIDRNSKPKILLKNQKPHQQKMEIQQTRQRRRKNFSLQIEDIILRDTNQKNQNIHEQLNKGIIANKISETKQTQIIQSKKQKFSILQTKSMLQIFNCKRNMRKNRNK